MEASRGRADLAADPMYQRRTIQRNDYPVTDRTLLVRRLARGVFMAKIRNDGDAVLSVLRLVGLEPNEPDRELICDRESGERHCAATGKAGKAEHNPEATTAARA